MKRLGGVAEFLDNMRRPISRSKRKQGTYPYYGASGAIDHIDEYIFDERLLLIGEDGAKWGPFEKTAFIVEGKYWVNNHAHVLRPVASNDVLLENYLNATDVSVYVTGFAPPKLTLDNLKSIRIPISPVQEEQQKIADCLASLDDLIRAGEAQLVALKDHKKGLMQQLFPREGETTPRLRFPEFRDAGEWGVKRLGEVCDTYSGGTPTSSNKEYYGGNIPFIRSAEIDTGTTKLHLTESGLRNSSAKLVKKGDLLIALYGANSGDAAIGKINGAINQAILCLRCKVNNNFILNYWLLMKQCISLRYLQGGQGNLSGEIVTSVEVPFPSIQEQQKIADCLASIDGLIRARAVRIEALKSYKRGLMQQLFPSIDGVRG